MSERLALRVGCTRCPFWIIRSHSVPAEKKDDFKTSAAHAKALADSSWPQICRAEPDVPAHPDGHDTQIQWTDAVPETER